MAIPRLALKLAYDGRRFVGSQRQPKARTVEGELLSALRRIGAIEDVRACNFQAASRTDRGVSALGNVVALSTGFAPASLLRALNAELEGIWTWQHAEAPDGFNPRHARSRWYRYYLPAAGLDLGLVRQAASLLVGDHDFSRFARLAGRRPLRRIDSVEIAHSAPFVLMDFRAPNFLWNMVRRLVWALEAVGRGRLQPEQLAAALQGGPLRSGVAPPEPLILMDVDIGLSFTTDASAAAIARRSVEQLLGSSSLEVVYYHTLLDCLGDSEG